MAARRLESRDGYKVDREARRAFPRDPINVILSAWILVCIGVTVWDFYSGDHTKAMIGIGCILAGGVVLSRWQAAREVARQQGRSLNALIRQHLEMLAGEQWGATSTADELLGLMREQGGHSRGWQYRRDDLHQEPV